MKKGTEIKFIAVVLLSAMTVILHAQENKNKENISEKKVTSENCVSEYSEEKSDVTKLALLKSKRLSTPFFIGNRLCYFSRKEIYL